MSRPAPKLPTSEDVVRISFLLDYRRAPELTHMRDLKGYGDRPRELMRLAILGAKYEREQTALAQAARRAGISVKDGQTTATIAVTPSANAETKPARVAEPVRQAKPHSSGASGKSEAAAVSAVSSVLA